MDGKFINMSVLLCNYQLINFLLVYDLDCGRCLQVWQQKLKNSHKKSMFQLLLLAHRLENFLSARFTQQINKVRYFK